MNTPFIRPAMRGEVPTIKSSLSQEIVALEINIYELQLKLNLLRDLEKELPQE